MSLVSSDWLEKNLDNVKIIDCSWHMPQTKRNGLEEYKIKHIPNSIFFEKIKHTFSNNTTWHSSSNMLICNSSNISPQCKPKLNQYSNQSRRSSTNGKLAQRSMARSKSSCKRTGQIGQKCAMPTGYTCAATRWPFKWRALN